MFRLAQNGNISLSLCKIVLQSVRMEALCALLNTNFIFSEKGNRLLPVYTRVYLRPENKQNRFIIDLLLAKVEAV